MLRRRVAPCVVVPDTTRHCAVVERRCIARQVVGALLNTDACSAMRGT